jgi:hypothetical protein
MTDSWFRKKSAECGRMARDANLTDADRARCKHQEDLWLQIADIEERRVESRRAKLASCAVHK